LVSYFFVLEPSYCLYGKPGAYGVVTLPFSVREGINIFLAGFVPTENVGF
jgi:ATP-binding cassette, sub-family E, member 1